MHPRYNSNTEENDVMILKLASAVNQATTVQLSLNDRYSVPSNGQDLTVLGLGDLRVSVLSERCFRLCIEM